MQSLRRGNRLARMGSGCFLRRALWGWFLIASLASAQMAQKSVAKKAAAQRANELTLGDLRPGRDLGSRATQLYGRSKAKDDGDRQLVWQDVCNRQSFSVELDHAGRIQVMRATESEQQGVSVDCHPVAASRWKTGHGLRIGDFATKVMQLYGPPDSKSPSTRDGQPLELWYYAFDWAGPDVPQVMEVLCTREKDGQPGRVVEITLAAPSL